MNDIFKLKNISQQTIVSFIFLIMFAGFSVFLPGFFATGNLLGLLQNVAILGILGLAMAIIVIGRYPKHQTESTELPQQLASTT